MAIHVREMVKRARRRLLGFDGSMLERNLSILMSNVAQADSLTTQDSLLRLSLLESTEAVYTKLPPCPENSISLFSGQWISAIPGFQTGEAGLFEDSRVEWLSAQLGELDGWSVLELGPLEGGHTRMLEARGCSVLAVEANVDAFLRCLVVKNLFDLKASFLLGDFTTPARG